VSQFEPTFGGDTVAAVSTMRAPHWRQCRRHHHRERHGDGVNIAGRLERIAELGGASISEDAWRRAQGKVAI
jgi:hypothetical protein